MAKDAKNTKNVAKDLFKKAMSLFIEEEDEIVGSGLDDAEVTEMYTNKNTKSIEGCDIEEELEPEVEEQETVKDSLKNEVKEKIKNKSLFSKPKQKTLEEDLFNEEEPNIMEEMKSMPFQPVEIIEIDTPVATSKGEGNNSYKKVSTLSENVTDELTKEQQEKELFFSRLDKGESVVNKLRVLSLFREIEEEVFGNGFEETFYSLMEAIEDNQLLEKQEKLDKMNGTLANLMSINIEEDEEVYNFFMMLKHELHKVKNSLGEYSSKVLGDKDLKVKTVLDYNISDICQNPKYSEALLESDREKYIELQNLVRDMYFEVEDNKFIAKEKKTMMHEEYKDILLSSNTLCDILKNIEILKEDLDMIRNEIGRFSRTELVLG